MGVALQVGLLDSFYLPPAGRLAAYCFGLALLLRWGRAWAPPLPLAPAACPPHGPFRRESEPFAAMRSLKLWICCVACDPVLQSPNLLPPCLGNSGWV